MLTFLLLVKKEEPVQLNFRIPTDFARTEVVLYERSVVSKVKVHGRRATAPIFGST